MGKEQVLTFLSFKPSGYLSKHLLLAIWNSPQAQFSKLVTWKKNIDKHQMDKLKWQIQYSE